MPPPLVDRYWLLTWTTYGTWLPGDRRGFVSPVHNESHELVLHNVPGTPVDTDLPILQSAARNQMRGEPIYLTAGQAAATVSTIRAHAEFRRYRLSAVAVMANHIHLVVGAANDPEPESLLGDFKAYASRTLNQKWTKPMNGTWWTRSGSKRKLPDEAAVLAAVRYVKNQQRPLAMWIEPEFDR